MAEIIDGANTTAQWFQNTYLGTRFTHLEKAVLHTTETRGWPAYSGGASAPNLTYHPQLRQKRQHFENNRSARALRDPTGTTVRENRDNVWQAEIVAYSDYALARSVGGLWIGDLQDEHYKDLARMLVQLHNDLSLPLRNTVTWKEGARSYYGGVRLSGPSYDAYRGILGHIHVSGNTHWDPGGFRASKLMAKIRELTQPTPPPPPPPPPPILEENPMLVIKQTGSDAIWYIEGGVRRHIKTLTLFSELSQLPGVSYDPDVLITTDLLRAWTTQGPDIIWPPPPEPTPTP